jgi:type III secretion protein I
MEVTASLLAAAALAPNTPPAVASTAAADPLAAARFSAIMEAPVEAVPQMPEVQLQPVAAEALQANGTMGDSILSGMQNLSVEFQQSWKTVNSALESGSAMTTSDMLKLQMGLTQMSIQYELVGKAISRSTQNLDQLVKMQ